MNFYQFSDLVGKIADRTGYKFNIDRPITENYCNNLNGVFQTKAVKPWGVNSASIYQLRNGKDIMTRDINLPSFYNSMDIIPRTTCLYISKMADWYTESSFISLDHGCEYRRNNQSVL